MWSDYNETKKYLVYYDGILRALTCCMFLNESDAVMMHLVVLNNNHTNYCNNDNASQYFLL